MDSREMIKRLKELAREPGFEDIKIADDPVEPPASESTEFGIIFVPKKPKK